MPENELYWFDLHTTMLKVSNEIVDNLQHINVKPSEAEALKVYVEAYNTLRGLWEKNASEADDEGSYEVDKATELVSYPLRASAALIFLNHILPALPMTAEVKDIPWREDVNLEAHAGNEGGYYLSIIIEALNMMVTEGLSYPVNLENSEEWNDVLLTMKAGLVEYLSEGINAPAEKTFYLPKKANEATLLIHNWFGNLWD